MLVINSLVFSTVIISESLQNGIKKRVIKENGNSFCFPTDKHAKSLPCKIANTHPFILIFCVSWLVIENADSCHSIYSVGENSFICIVISYQIMIPLRQNNLEGADCIRPAVSSACSWAFQQQNNRWIFCLLDTCYKTSLTN